MRVSRILVVAEIVCKQRSIVCWSNEGCSHDPISALMFCNIQVNGPREQADNQDIFLNAI